MVRRCRSARPADVTKAAEQALELDRRAKLVPRPGLLYPNGRAGREPSGGQRGGRALLRPTRGLKLTLEGGRFGPTREAGPTILTLL